MTKIRQNRDKIRKNRSLPRRGNTTYNQAMYDIPNKIADVLLELEASLRIHGKWDESKPKASDLKSSIPFCMDTLKFEQWLQWIFLPTMKDTIEQTKPLPLETAIFEYAEECLLEADPSTRQLLKQLKLFDNLISVQASVRRH